MGRKEFTQGTQVTGANSAEPNTTLVADQQDISGGVTANLQGDEYSVYITGTAGDSIAIEVNTGTGWVPIDESPVDIQNTGFKSILVEYIGEEVRFTNSTGTDPTTVVLSQI